MISTGVVPKVHGKLQSAGTKSLKISTDARLALSALSTEISFFAVAGVPGNEKQACIMLEDQTRVQPDALKAYIAAIKADNERLVAQLSEREAQLATTEVQLAELTAQLSQREAQLAGEKTRADQAIAELTALTQRIAEQQSRPRWLSWRRRAG
jgi:septal ring factor EnvC (AmiA/AmiB activator)